MNPQLHDELRALKGKSKILNPKKVVDWAGKNPKSELHKHFEWDDKKAGAAFRLWQARELIKLDISHETSAPNWVSLSIDRNPKGGYRNAEDVKGDANLRAILLRDVINDFVRIRQRNADLHELTILYQMIDRLAAEYAPQPTSVTGRDVTAATTATA